MWKTWYSYQNGITVYLECKIKCRKYRIASVPIFETKGKTLTLLLVYAFLEGVI